MSAVAQHSRPHSERPPAPQERLLGQDRPLCFLHIAKTGGTSLTDAIARAYAPDRIFTDGGNLSVPFVRRLCGRLKGPAFLAGHPAEGVGRLLSSRGDLITVLRRPCDQAVSNFLHVTSDPSNPLHAQAAAGSFGDFLRGTPGQIDYQATALALALRREGAANDQAPSGELEDVLAFIAGAPFVGVIEQGDLCGRVLSRLLGRPIELACLNTAVYRGVRPGVLRRLQRQYEDLRADPSLAAAFAREDQVYAAAVAALERAALAAGVSADPVPATDREIAVPAVRFSSRTGRPSHEGLVTDLAGSRGHLTHGPYDRLGAGCWSVQFEFRLDGASPAAGRVKLEVVSNGRVCLRRRWLHRGRWVSARARTLWFVNLRASDVLEFRLRARGFDAGRLVFHQATLRRSTLWRAWPSAPFTLVFWAVERIHRSVRPLPPPEPAPIPILARAAEVGSPPVEEARNTR